MQTLEQIELFSEAELEYLQFLPEELEEIESEQYPDLESISLEEVAKDLEAFFEEEVEEEETELERLWRGRRRGRRSRFRNRIRRKFKSRRLSKLRDRFRRKFKSRRFSKLLRRKNKNVGRSRDFHPQIPPRRLPNGNIPPRPPQIPPRTLPNGNIPPRPPQNGSNRSR